MVARRLFLLVARLLLLVDDDQPEIFDRRENGRARAHHHARLAAPRRATIRARARHPAGRCAAPRRLRRIARAPDRPTHSVSAISGTSTSAVFPRASAASTAPRYTSVLPLPVTPCSKPAVNLPATSQRQISPSALLLLGFKIFEGGVKSVSQESSSIVSGSSQLCNAFFFEALEQRRAKRPLFQRADGKRQRPRVRGQHFADSFLRRRCASADSLELAGIPRDNFLRARAAAARTSRAFRYPRRRAAPPPLPRRAARCSRTVPMRLRRSIAEQRKRSSATSSSVIPRLTASSCELCAARIGERIFAVVAQFDFRRQHCAKRLHRSAQHSSGRPIGPVPSASAAAPECGSSTSTISLIAFCSADRGARSDSPSAHADHRAIAKRHEHAAPRDRSSPLSASGTAYVNVRAQRNRQRDFAIAGTCAEVV